MNEPTIRLIVCWSLIAVQLFFIIHSISVARTSTKRLLRWTKERYHVFTNQMTEKYETFRDEATDRINLLSKENVKLRFENEKYRQKLNDLGLLDDSLDN